MSVTDSPQDQPSGQAPEEGTEGHLSSSEAEASFEAEASSETEGRPSVALPLGTGLREEYRVEEVLGSGSFGITYRARDTNLKADVAIKEYCPRRLAGRTEESLTVRPYSSESTERFEKGLQRFMEEGRTLARFDHPNVVSVRSFFEENGTGYLVMDYYEGESLSEYLGKQGGTLPEKEAVSLMLDVLSGLQAVHEEGVLHRDIGPKNIYRRSTGEALLIDFGAAREAVGMESQDLTTVLTPGYAPIEQYMAERQGPRTDIYACAATLHRCLVGEAPTEARRRAQGEEIESPRQAGADVSFKTDLAVRKGLAMKPERRPQSAEAFAALLREDLGEETGRTVKATQREPRAGEDLDLEEGQVPAFDESAGEEDAGEVPPAVSEAAEGEGQTEKERSFWQSAGPTLGLALAALASVGGTLLFSEQSPAQVLAYFGSWAAVVGGTVLLFREGEKAMTPGARAAVSDWLLKEDFAERPAGWPETFISLFDAVFTEDHLSWTCFKRSAMASLAIVFSLVLVFYSLGGIGDGWPLVGILFAALFFSAVNIVVDYISLFETRIVLGWISSLKRTYVSTVLIVFDFFFSLFLLFIIFGAVLVVPVRIFIEGESITQALSVDVAGFIHEVTLNSESADVVPMVYSTLFTSVWVWLYAISGATIRALYPLLTGIDRIKHGLDVETRPVHSIGLLLAVIMSVGFALSAPFVL